MKKEPFKWQSRYDAILEVLEDAGVIEFTPSDIENKLSSEDFEELFNNNISLLGKTLVQLSHNHDCLTHIRTKPSLFKWDPVSGSSGNDRQERLIRALAVVDFLIARYEDKNDQCTADLIREDVRNVLRDELDG